MFRRRSAIHKTRVVINARRLTAAALLVSGSLTVAVCSAEEPAPAEPKPSLTPPSVDDRTRKELLEREERLGAAIKECNPAMLDKLLADYYADSDAGAKRAHDKRGTLARCRDGRLPSYVFEGTPQLTRSGDVITIEGEAKRGGAELSEERGAGKSVHVRRLWAKVDGHWLLIAQVVGRR